MRARDDTKLIGEWKNDKANGKCTCTYGSGASFVGFYVDDMKEGQGKFIGPTGDTYEGEFRGDKILGKGLFIDRRNRTSFFGTFKNGQRQGTTDEEACYTLHHRLYGDFRAKGGVRYGSDVTSGNGKGVDRLAALKGAPPTPPKSPKDKHPRKKVREFDMPAQKRHHSPFFD